MRIRKLEREQWIQGSVGEVFKFFADPANLERITPPWLHFHLLTPPWEIHQGTRLDYRLRLRGLPIRWQSVIRVWEPPGRFVDEQVRGPYRLWIHEHTFAAQDGGTLVRDYVRYAVYGDAVIHSLLVEPDLKRIFEYRRERLHELLQSDPGERKANQK